jgi:hypothetical protein
LIAASQPFIQSVATTSPKASLFATIIQQVQGFMMAQFQRPNRSEQFMQTLEGKIERGELQFRIRSMESDRLLKRIHLAIKSLIYACLTGFTLLSASVLVSTIYAKWAVMGFGLAGLFSLFLLRSLIQLALQERVDNMINK